MAYGYNEDKTKANIEDIAAASMAGKVDKVSGKGLSDNNFTYTDKAIVDGFTAALSGKVDKIPGKGLSTNDFTTALKSRVDERAYNTFDGSKVILAENGISDYVSYTCPHDGYVAITNNAGQFQTGKFKIKCGNDSYINFNPRRADYIHSLLVFVKKGTIIDEPTALENTSVIYYPLTSYT